MTYLLLTIDGLLEPEAGFVFLGRVPGHSLLLCQEGEGRIMAVMPPNQKPLLVLLTLSHVLAPLWD